MTGKALNWLLIIIINFLWATQVPVIRLIGDRLSPVFVAFAPLILSNVIFLPILLIQTRRQNTPMRWRWGDIKNFVLPGLIGMFVMQYAYTLGSTLTLAANAGLITLTIPVLVSLFASVLLHEKTNAIRIISFIVAIAGVLMTSGSDVEGADFGQGQYLTGNLIFFFACVCCAFYNTYCKKLIAKYSELEILVYSSLIASIASIPVLLWVEKFDFSTFPLTDKIAVFGILELGIVVFGFSMLLFFYVLKKMDLTQAILGTYLLPFFIALMGFIMLNEKITMLMLFGGALILVSTLMVTVYEKVLLSTYNNVVKWAAKALTPVTKDRER
jgi:drug/metabolite transporter (DMT)-like permease